MSILEESPHDVENSGRMLLDEPYLRSKGVDDFSKYVLCLSPLSLSLTTYSSCTILISPKYQSHPASLTHRYQCVPGSEPPTLDQVAKLLMGAGDKAKGKYNDK